MTLQHDPAPAARPEFPVLDTLRFVGALCVLTTHTSFESGEYAGHGIWGQVLARLDVGVAVFFVLSGFLLFRPHIAAAAAGRAGPRTARYYWKRFLRIYPLYAVTVVLALSLIPENQGSTVREWLRTLLMLDSFTTPLLPQGLTQMWSLAVEASFYLALPLLAVLAFGRGVHRWHPHRFVVLLLVMVGVSVAWHAGLGERVDAHSDGTPMTWLPSYLTWFAVGMLLAFAHVRMQDGDTGRLVTGFRTLGAMPGACWAGVAGLMLVAATPVAGPTQLFVPTDAAESLTKHVLYALIGGLVVLTGVFAVPGLYSTVMAHPLPRHLGHISYSIFCLHVTILYFVMNDGPYQIFNGPGLEIWAITLGLSLVASELGYRLVERPAQRLRGFSPRSWTGSRTGSQPTTSDQASTTRS